MVRGRSHPNRKVPLMRKMTMLIALALLASACVGGGTGVGVRMLTEWVSRRCA